MTDITIPPEALDAVAEALAEADDGTIPYDELARVACLAMLDSWPGMAQALSTGSIILPLPGRTKSPPPSAR